MPFLRVVRDKRGYETTYLMHWYREGAKQRSRILYVFRTPGGVRVGRDPLDAAVQHEIEARHPDIEFDWDVVIDNQQVIESAPEPPRARKRRRADDEAAVTPAAPEARATTALPAPPSRPPVPPAIEGATPDEQIAFLAHWYPLVRERVPNRTADPMRQQALMTLAERLNPASWTDADQITFGLQEAAEALERLAHVFARRRRRSRRGRASPALEPSAIPGPSSESSSAIQEAASPIQEPSPESSSAIEEAVSESAPIHPDIETPSD
jgi:hypothetical protein